MSESPSFLLRRIYRHGAAGRGVAMNWRGGGTLPLPQRGYAAIPFRNLFNRWSSSATTSTKLFVGGLSYHTNETALKDAFSPYGHVIAVKVICHPTTGRSKGFGFVMFSSQNEAAAAAHSMNGQVLDGRNIRVHYSNSG